MKWAKTSTASFVRGHLPMPWLFAGDTKDLFSTATAEVNTVAEHTKVCWRKTASRAPWANRDARMIILAKSSFSLCSKAFFRYAQKRNDPIARQVLQLRRKYAIIEDVKTDLYRYIELFYNRKLSAELQAVPRSRLYESRGIPSRKLAVSPSKWRRDFSVFRSATLHGGPKNRKKRQSIDVVSYDFGCFNAG